jgi:sulfur relay (sulfurtransferase) complex TusBCD TusD component (DsrE family)
MKFIRALSLMCVLCTTFWCELALAAQNNILLVNLISYTTPESRKAIEYAKAARSQGRPVIIFLYDRAVMVASKENADQFIEQQRNLRELMERGATILVCPHCMKLYTVADSNLLTGIQIAAATDHS